MKIKKGDKVVVTAGKDKNRQGSVDRVYKKEKKALIPGINMFKKHVKKTGQKESGIISFAKPINIANIALICPECSKKTRVGYTFINKDKKRICKKCKKII